MFEFKLPDLGEGIHEGEVLKWHVEVGQTIAEDDPLVEVETDKAAVTIPSPRSGKIVSVSGKEGDIVEVGQILTVFDDGAGASSKEDGRGAEKAEAKPASTSPRVTATRLATFEGLSGFGSTPSVKTKSCSRGASGSIVAGALGAILLTQAPQAVLQDSLSVVMGSELMAAVADEAQTVTGFNMAKIRYVTRQID